ncbi:DUF309 domain-containing protein [Neobacillus notoginsengisoli]|uniref:DUF309 domain-containing protein n=1 Tax=Neobacillus notoginsengisoli TaxID=1578198 RepID=A0A417YVD6_9BACI|nr:DUF309 domain-containing protein [Neobacillus notoginsengisoli]RHW41198.1 DUF309 domain-containing protein [Neobacillus notoginsengisoli]
MYPKSYVDYLVHFHGDRDYFECHEILEDYWKDHEPGNKNSIWAAFIQLAVGCYHYRRGNAPGAQRTLHKALAIFHGQKKKLDSLGIHTDELLSELEEFISSLSAGRAYKSFIIPIKDPKLKELCLDACVEKGFNWCRSDYFPTEAIIDRHKTRDRTSVIEEREMALKRKNQIQELGNKQKESAGND